MIAKKVATGALLTLLASGCSSKTDPPMSPAPPCAEAPFAKGRASVRCERVVDAEGRVVLLHGVNARVAGVFDVTFDDGRVALESIPAFAAEDAARARAMGFNALRLPLQWSALEPKDGAGFDEKYLDRVQAVVKLAHEAGLSTLLDIHQDAYSKEIGEDGAPLWAILPPPLELLQGPLMDLGARRSSKQVFDAFGTFFGGSPDGVRLRTRFAAAAAHLAERFAGDDAVIGIEAFNEPISDPEHLDLLHDEVIRAVRAKDPGRLVFFEPGAQRNLYDNAPDATHDPWPGTVYAPHIYTFSFDATPPKSVAKEVLAPSNDAAVHEASTWKAPLVITELGYSPAAAESDQYLANQTDLEDERFAGGFFWLWKEQSQGAWGLYDYDVTAKTWKERDHVRKALARVVVEALPGFPTKLTNDRSTGTFEVVYEGEAGITAPAVLHVPDALDFAATFRVTCDGASISATRDPTTGAVEVPCGGAGTHTLRLMP